MTNPIFKDLRTSPSDMTSQDKGFAMAKKTKTVGDSRPENSSCSFPLWPQKNKNHVIRKKSAGCSHGHGHCQKHGVALQEVALETGWVVLEPGQSRKCHFTGG